MVQLYLTIFCSLRSLFSFFLLFFCSYYYLSSDHYYEDRFHIHVINRSSNIWLSYIHNRLFTTSRVYLETTQWPALSWLVSSVGRALHQYHRGHGFKSRTGLNFFKPSFHYYLSSVHYSEDRFHIHVFSRSWNIWLPYIHNRLFVCLSVNRSIYPSVYLSMCLSIVLSICLSIYPSICLSTFRSTYLSVYISICLSIYLSVGVSICLSSYLPIYLSIIYLFIDLSIYLSFYLSICPYVYLYIYLSTYLSKYMSVYISIYIRSYLFISVAMITLHVNTLGYGNFSTRSYHLY